MQTAGRGPDTSAWVRLAFCVAVLSAVCPTLASQAPPPSQSGVQASKRTAPPDPSTIWNRLRADAVSESISSVDRSNPNGEAKLVSIQRGPLMDVDTKMPSEFQELIRKNIGMVARIRISTLSFEPFNGPDQALVKRLRESLGQKRKPHHIWYNVPVCGPRRNTTDMWWPGEPFNHAMLLIESRTTVTLVTLRGDFRTNGDVVHLAGYLGIPRFDACAVSGLEKNRPVLDPYE